MLMTNHFSVTDFGNVECINPPVSAAVFMLEALNTVIKSFIIAIWRNNMERSNPGTQSVSIFCKSFIIGCEPFGPFFTNWCFIFTTGSCLLYFITPPEGQGNCFQSVCMFCLFVLLVS